MLIIIAHTACTSLSSMKFSRRAAKVDISSAVECIVDDCAIQGHPRSLILASIKSVYTSSY